MAFPVTLCYNSFITPKWAVHAVAIEHGQRIMRGLCWNDPFRIRSWPELIRWIDELEPAPSRELMFKHVQKNFPAATQAALGAALG